MAHKILKQTTIAFLTIMVSSNMLSAESDTSRRLKALEQKVATMQIQLHELTVINKQLRNQINQLSTSDNTDLLACDDRALALQGKLDQLQKLGFKDNHPDVSNVRAQLEDVKLECQNNSMSNTLESVGCTARITKLRQEKDAQLALGFQPTHPDILSMTTLIDRISSECRPG